jgi:hypothetical protein
VRDFVLSCVELLSRVERSRAEPNPPTGDPRRQKLKRPPRHVVELLTPGEVADAAGVDASHLARALAADDLPSAEEMITWCRLLRAAWFLALLPGRSGERVALALHFTSGAQLGDTLHRMTKMRTMDVRARGGFAPVMAVLRERLTKVVSTQVGPPAPRGAAHASG